MRRPEAGDRGTGNRAATTFDGIADNGSGGAAVLGPAVENWQQLPFDTMEIDARIDDIVGNELHRRGCFGPIFGVFRKVDEGLFHRLDRFLRQCWPRCCQQL